ncbi:hypothetical protein G3I78_44085, partial [Streptomyces sp. SID13726]|nr:hypothetical protein [Streptomyces sp. SID13726]
MLKATNAGFDTLDGVSGSGSTRRTVLAAGAGLAATACTRAAEGPEGRTGPGSVRQPGVAAEQRPAVLVLAYDLDPAVSGPAGARALRPVLREWSRAHATIGVGPRL